MLKTTTREYMDEREKAGEYWKYYGKAWETNETEWHIEIMYHGGADWKLSAVKGSPGQVLNVNQGLWVTE